MEGSPVRGQQRVPIIRLNESHDLQSFQAEFVRLLAAEFKHAEVSFGIVDIDLKMPQLPAWIRSHLERQPGLQKKLEQGEMVGISAAEENPVLRPAAAAHSNVVLIPVINDGRLAAAIGLVSPLDGPQVSAEDIEVARQFAYDALPILTRLEEIERLQDENRKLLAKADRAERAEESLAALRARGMLAAYGQASGPVPPFEIVRLAGFSRAAGNGSLFVTWSSNGDYTATRQELLWRAGDVFNGILEGTLHVEVVASFSLSDAARAHELLEGRGVTGKLLLLP